MNPSSPYGPDRSLPLAIGIITGVLLICAGGVYVVSSLPVGTGGGGGGIVGARGHAPAPSGYAAEGTRSRGGSSPIAGGGVPAWTGLDRPSAPTEPFAPVPQGSYDINPDLGHAELRSPSASAPPGSGAAGRGTSGGAVLPDAGSPGGGPVGGGPKTESAPTTPDLSGGPSGRAAVEGDAPQWRSEARALASRSRALSGEIARLNREEAAAGNAQRERAEQPSGDGSTASGGGQAQSSTPGTPNPPDQVPLGGAEWLAAAGAAYALNRLREKDGDEGDSEDDA
ncbi:MAG: hypothetical protein ABEL04_03295 [Salinibacter sp.]|uniref:hypothetical protein n=1 Tax=Salinibacter sp. TaxID=2065818 RepID=UPI0035D4B1D0